MARSRSPSRRPSSFPSSAKWKMPADRSPWMSRRPGDIVYLLGETGNELGGSEYLAASGFIGNKVPLVDAEKAYRRYRAYHEAVMAGTVASCHDLSDGGLAVAAAESAFAGGLRDDSRSLPASPGKEIPRTKTIRRCCFPSRPPDTWLPFIPNTGSISRRS